jgi:hypothetical protein
MNNDKQITGADILSMCPGLKEAMDNVLTKCREQNTEKFDIRKVMPEEQDDNE